MTDLSQAITPEPPRQVRCVKDALQRAADLAGARAVFDDLMAASPFWGVAAEHLGSVYFMQSDFDGDFAVKIGRATSPSGRLNSIQSGNPNKIEMLAFINCDMRAEAIFHKHFAGAKIRGEWFALTDEVETFIDKLVDYEVVSTNGSGSQLVDVSCPEVAFILATMDSPWSEETVRALAGIRAD
jgi:hypothetical protein